MLTFLFLNQTLWCYHSLESSRRDDYNEGHIIGFGWEMRKLSWKSFCSPFLNCGPALQPNKISRRRNIVTPQCLIKKQESSCYGYRHNALRDRIFSAFWALSVKKLRMHKASPLVMKVALPKKDAWFMFLSLNTYREITQSFSFAQLHYNHHSYPSRSILVDLY